MAEFKDKLSAKLHKAMKDNVVVQNAIKSALASYDRQYFSSVSVVPAVDTVTDTPAQQISVQNDGLSRRFQFLQYCVHSCLPFCVKKDKEGSPLPNGRTVSNLMRAKKCIYI